MFLSDVCMSACLYLQCVSVCICACVCARVRMFQSVSRPLYLRLFSLYYRLVFRSTLISYLYIYVECMRLNVGASEREEGAICVQVYMYVYVCVCVCVCLYVSEKIMLYLCELRHFLGFV